ncbi:MFS general substrate transporter [Westerdykella ornata]|uniref:MFS general substrate transporter n=1 Tax=Westerdykella ornata TaxID=318751 RepID=A0A6A6J8Z2_WESOR|nr:MFS general substrate transporter [Westerdykella ornata]KAF2272674.1 MFS general substrate transporter [Westerdykella ornata]
MAPDHFNEPFPTKQLIIIGICRFSEPIAFNSILAYSYVMVQDLGIPEKDASFYSGLLISAYAVAEALTALGWGAISDVYGRKPVALLGLGGVALSSLLFGLAGNYWVALLARLVGGALNGNVAIMQTMVAEVVKNPAHEPRAYATQPFVWTLGGIIGSAMGGFLAKPATFYPHLFSQDGLFGRYPYLLPNLVAAVAILLAIIQGIIFLEETNPALIAQEDDSTIDEHTPLNRARPRDRRLSSLSRASFRDRSNSVLAAIREVRKRPSFLEESLPLPIEQRFDLRRASFGTMHSISLPPPTHVIPPRPTAAPKRTFNYTVIMVTLSLVIICYHQMAFVSVIPVFILDEPHTAFGQLDLHGGLGGSLHEVGTYLAVNGVLALFIQAFVFPPFVEAVGVWKSFVAMILLYPTCYLIPPFITVFPEWAVGPGVYLTFILQDIYGIIVFPCALILLKNATPSPLVLGRVNGMAMSACCLARTVSSPLVGLVYSLGGSAVAWWSLAGAAVVGAVQLCWVPREGVEKVLVKSVIGKVADEGAGGRRRRERLGLEEDEVQSEVFDD